jgi:hypothetical protein
VDPNNRQTNYSVSLVNGTLTVHLLPTILTQPQSQTVPVGSNVSFSITATNANFTLPLLPSVNSGTLQLWLKADAGVVTNGAGLVSQWQDQSGNENNASQTSAINQPLLVSAIGLGGAPAVRFNGIQDNVNGSYMFGTGVVGLSNALTSFTVYNAFSAIHSENLLWATGSSGQCFASRGDLITGGDLRFTFWCLDYSMPFVVPTNTYRIRTDRLDTNVDTLNVFDATAVSATNFTVAVEGAAPAGSGYNLGGGNPSQIGSSRCFNGDIAELICYQGYLSEADRLAVTSYLEQKYYQIGTTIGLSYQWQFDGTNIEGGTNTTLSLPSISLDRAGSYQVVISNMYGSVTSSPAVLNAQFIFFSVNGQYTPMSATSVASAEVMISGGYSGGFLFYTTDGSTPTESSTLYVGPFTLTNSALVQALGVNSDFSQSTLATPVTVQIIPVYNLQTSVTGSGTVSLNPASGPYASNTVVTLTATAAPNWAFAYWTGGISGSENPINVTVTGPLNVQAVFVQTNFPLTVSTPGGGSVTVNGQVISPNTYYSTNSVVTLSATASNGWSFLGWQGDASGTNNPLSLTINQTNNIQALFGTIVATNTVGGGGIVLNLANPVPYDTTLTASAVPNAGKYLVLWSGAASGTNTPTTILVTNATPTVDALFTSLPGGKYSLAIVVVGNGAVVISPQKSYYNPGDSVTLSASTTNAGTTFFGWTGNASGSNNSIMVIINSNMVVQANFGGVLPIVNITPQNLIVYAGSNAVLTANATGFPPLSYQWQNSQGAIAGQTNTTFSIVDAQATNSDSYSVVVFNPFGSVTSAVATVTVVYTPSISVQPIPQTVAAGSSLTLSVSASGTAPLAYQWQVSEGLIEGATNSSLTIDPVLTNYTDNYWVVVSNAYGVVTSQVAAVFVYAPVTIQSQPNSLVVPDLAPASFAVAASGFPPPTSYQWMHNATNIPGATSSVFTISRVHLSDSGYYQVFVSNAYSFTNSDIATLNMSPSLTSPFTGATTIWGTSAVLTVGAIGSGDLSYQWYVGGVAIDGATNSALDFTSIQFTNGGLYSVVVTSPYGSVTNAPAQVIINPAGVALGFSPTLTITGVAGYSYIIQSSTNLADTNAWVTVTNLTLTQPVQLWVDTNVDASSPFNPTRFYQRSCRGNDGRPAWNTLLAYCGCVILPIECVIAKLPRLWERYKVHSSPPSSVIFQPCLNKKLEMPVIVG